jgi:hypothetical protein
MTRRCTRASASPRSTRRNHEAGRLLTRPVLGCNRSELCDMSNICSGYEKHWISPKRFPLDAVRRHYFIFRGNLCLGALYCFKLAHECAGDPDESN